MVVLVAGERGAPAFDGVGEEGGGAVVGYGVEGVGQGLNAMAAEIVHQLGEVAVASLVEKGRHGLLISDVVHEAGAPGGAALEGQGGVQLIGAAVDPVPKERAAGLDEGGLLQCSVFQGDDLPAEGLEDGLDPLPEILPNHAIKALAVVVDDPPAVPKVMLPTLLQAFIDIALVELGIANERDHAADPTRARPLFGFEIVLDDGGEGRDRHPEPHRARGEIHVIDILGAARIGLRPTVAAKGLQLLLGLQAHQILHGVKHGRSVRLDRDPVLRTQHMAVQRRYDRHHRCRRRLMPADLDLVFGPDVIGVVDHPAGKPEQALFQYSQMAKLGVMHLNAIPTDFEPCQLDPADSCTSTAGSGERSMRLTASSS